MSSERQEKKLANGCDGRTHRCDSRTESFCARALHNEVFPVPGGPCKSTTRFQDTMLTTHILCERIGSCKSKLTVDIGITK